METIIRIKASELDKKFLATVKELFKKRDVEITITDIVSDETSHLLKDSKNKAHLLQAIDEVKKGKNVVSFNAKEFKEYSQLLLKK